MSEDGPIEIISFYEFKRLGERDVLEQIRLRLKDALLQYDVRGTIIIASEGYNGMVCGKVEQIAEFVTVVETIFRTRLHLKSSFHEHAPFRKIDVKIKPEIVTLKQQVDISLGQGTHVDPAKWNELIADPNTVVLDARNDYEHETGTFERAINPATTKFSELPKFVADNLDPERDKRIAMFCTGGIRCEKFAPYLKQIGFDEVYQLNGGILKYLEEVPPEESLWHGECFVFDERVSVNASLKKGSGPDHSQRLAKRQESKIQGRDMKISPARTAAFDILLRVETERAFTSVLLPLYEDNLSTADRGLCHELVLGTLRRQIWLDRAIDALTRGKKLDIEVRIALRLGIYQLNFLDKVPPYSAINESVNLVQRARKTSAKPFVNAVLRRVAKDQIQLSYADDLERMSVETSHPRWLIEKWIGDFGKAEATEVAEANNRIGGTAFRVIDEANDEIAEVIETARPSANVEGCYIIEKPDARLYALAEKGTIYIQDEASQMTVLSVAVPDGGRFLDVCAAPGGKTGLLALRSPATQIVAGDLYWPRVQFLRDNCRRQKAENVSVLQYDAEKGLPFADTSFDAVFVDAPCSGTGTIRRNPEIRYFLQPDDLSQLALKQLRILAEASKLVKPGGVLTYSTCSLEKEENESVCEQFLASGSAFRPVKPLVPVRFIGNDGFARTFPHRDDMDGFFIASFERAES